MPRSKLDNIVEVVRGCLDSGQYLDTRHALTRKTERQISLPEIQYVLRNGYHEKKKDEFKPEYNAWNYAIRGKTVDGRGLRICVSFDAENMLIITAIALTERLP